MEKQKDLEVIGDEGDLAFNDENSEDFSPGPAAKENTAIEADN